MTTEQASQCHLQCISADQTKLKAAGLNSEQKPRHSVSEDQPGCQQFFFIKNTKISLYLTHIKTFSNKKQELHKPCYKVNVLWQDLTMFPTN